MIASPFVDACAAKDLLCDVAVRSGPRQSIDRTSATYIQTACLHIYRGGVMVLLRGPFKLKRKSDS